MKIYFLIAMLFPMAAVAAEFKFAGDMRLRHVQITDGAAEMRTRQELMTRFGLGAEITPQLKGHLRLMTDTRPTSGNVTLGDVSSQPSARRAFGLDHAYFDYAPVGEVHLFGGRMPGPFYFAGKNQLLLDRDLALEGWATKVQGDLSRHRLMLNAGGFILKERYDSAAGKDEADNMLYGGQLIYRLGFEEMFLGEADLSAWSLLIGVGQFGWTNFKDINASDAAAPFPSNGNSLDVNSRFLYNFDQQQIMAEIKGRLGTVDILIFHEALQNIDADQLNKANATGFVLTQKPLSFLFASQLVEKDSVVGFFSDGDFGGGNTSKRGRFFSLTWTVTPQVGVAYTQYDAETGINTPIPQPFKRSSLDLQMTF